MTVQVYKWSDAGAPQIQSTTTMSQAQGHLLAVLDACLINGYGTKSPLGWELTYTATNKRVYRIPAGRYLRAEDGIEYPSNWRALKVNGFESVSDIDTGTGRFPTTAQLDATWVTNAGGAYLPWQYTATVNIASPRRWVIIGDEKGFWLWLALRDSSDYEMCLSYFGEFSSEFTGELYNTILIGSLPLWNPNHSYNLGLGSMYQDSSWRPDTSGYTYSVAPRKYDGVGGAVFLHALHAIRGIGQVGLGGFTVDLPQPPYAAKLYLSQVHLWDAKLGFDAKTYRAGDVYRGVLPGLWLSGQQLGSAFDTFTDSDNNSYLLLPVRDGGGSSSSNPFKAYLQTNDWQR